MTDTQPIPTIRWVIVGALILAAAGSIAAMALIPPKTEPERKDTSPPGLPPLSPSAPPQGPQATQVPAPRSATPPPADGRQQPTVRPVTDPNMAKELNADLAAALSPPGEPWQYNPVTNKHWDPRKDHGHWHDGPPPKVGEDGQPIPWYYDPQTNKHWDPRPGHEHWHDGPVPDPPPEPSGPTSP